jgi:hypothetical protein
MKNISLVLLITLLFSCGNKNTSAQINNLQIKDTLYANNVYVMHNDTNFVAVFLDIEYAGKINVFDKPNGKITKTLENDFEKDKYINLDLLSKNDSMFYVVAYDAMDCEFIIKGWIYKKSYLSVYFSTYDRDLIIYKKAYDKKNIIVAGKENDFSNVKVLDFEGRWLKINFKYKEKNYEGWLSPDMQCSLIFTTCN